MDTYKLQGLNYAIYSWRAGYYSKISALPESDGDGAWYDLLPAYSEAKEGDEYFDFDGVWKVRRSRGKIKNTSYIHRRRKKACNCEDPDRCPRCPKKVGASRSYG